MVNVVAVNELILARMARCGWYRLGGCDRTHGRPEPHDINDGECEQWAIKARELFGGEEVWLDTFKTCADWAHCVLKLDGRYYDSIHPDGARTLREFIQQAKEYWAALDATV